MKTIKAFSLFTALAAATLLIAPRADAATITANLNDLVLGFYATGGTGASVNLEVDLGSITNYVDASGNPLTNTSKTVANLSAADLVAAFGSSWSTRTDLYFGIVGTTGRTGAGPLGEARNTLWVSAPEDTAGTLAVAWNRAGSSTQSSVASKIEPLFVNAPFNGTLNGATSTANSSTSAIIDASLPSCYQKADGVSPPTTVASFGYFLTGIDRYCGIATNGYAVLDLIELRPGSGTGTYLGSFGLKSDGTLTFSTDPTVFASPTAHVSSQPSDQTIADGGTATFTVTATGTPAPTFQWKVSTDGGTNYTSLTDGSPYSGTTTSTLTVSPASLALNQYFYKAVATNSGGSDTSNPAQLTVTAVAPAIAAQPQSLSLNQGNNATFTVTATGTAPLTYQWYKGVTALTNSAGHISGATTNSLSITSVQTGDVASYTVTVTNSGGSVTSDAATLTVGTPPATPTASAASVGNTSFTANWGSVSGATGYRLDVSTQSDFSTFLTGFQDLDVGTALSKNVTGLSENTTYYYRVRAVNSAGASASSSTISATTTASALSITQQPSSQSVVAGSNVSLTVTATSVTALSYQWRRNSQNLSGTTATTATLMLSSVQAADAGSYDVVVTNAAGSVTSDAATLTVIVTPSAPTTNAASSVTTSSFTANWSSVSGATGYRLDVSTSNTFGSFLTGFQNLDVGTNLSRQVTGLAENTTYYYRVRAANAAGTSVSSNPTTVATVAGLPGIATSPSSQSVIQGATVTFTVVATSSTSLSYAWKKDGNALTDGGRISGATTDTLTVTGALPADDGSYTVTVTNTAGSVSSDAATLTVQPPPAAPTATAATNLAIHGFTANWNSVTDTTGYRLDVSTDNAFGSFVTGYQDLDVGPNLSATVTGLTDHTTYYYRVRAVNAAGTSPSSNTITATTPASSLVIVTAPSSQSVIQGATVTFTVEVSSTTAVTYRWNKGNPPQALTDGGSISGATTATLTITGALPADDGDYTVTITNAAGSVTTDAVTLSVEPPPAAPVATDATDLAIDSFTANWDSAADTTGYRLDVSTDNTFGSFVDGYQDLDVGTNLSSAVTSLTDNATYYYRVRAVNAAGTSPSSNIVTVSTQPQPPAIATQPTNKGALLGDTITLTVVATGSAPLGYQWRKQSGTDFVDLTDGGSVSGATTDALTLTNVGATDAGTYQVHVSNTAGTVDSDAVTVSVSSGNVAPAIVTQPVGQSVNQGGTATFTVAASGVPTPTYQWRKDGVDITGATSATLTLKNLQATDAASYSVVATNVAGTATSNDAVLVVNLPPAIATQPSGQTVDQGGATTFTVVAMGIPTPTYQWSKNGSPITGATNATLTLTNVQASDAADYTVKLTNVAGAVTSSKATLVVNLPPTITTQPTGLSVNQGGTATFTVAATGVPAPTYRWQKNGSPIAGATGATLTLTNVQAGDAASYTVVATNSVGSATSDAAMLVVNLPPVITTHPVGQSVNVGGTAILTVAASGLPAPGIQWQKNGVAITGATSATLTLSNVQTGDAADYTAVATNVAGSATSAKATLVVNFPPAIITQPVGQTVNQGGTATFTVVASGVPAPTYQWLKAGSAIAGATSATLTLQNLQASDAADYTVTATNSLGSATSDAATLVVNTPPVFTTQPTGQTVDEGVSVVFSAAATGTPTPTYQWYKDDTAISGATSSGLTVSSTKAADAGDYTVVSTNAAGSATSTKATLVVNYAPTITTQPTDQTAAQGTTATFTVVAAGLPAPTYQWTKDGNNLAGATSATLSLPNVQPADAASYAVIVTNRLGSVTSTAAKLTVNFAPVFTTQPASTSAKVGDSVSFTVATNGMPTPTYQWQISADAGNTWSDLAETAPYSGTTTPTLTIASSTIAMDGYRYRAVAQNTFGTTNSSPAILTVTKPLATVTLSDLSATYDGTAKNATATTVPAGLTVKLTYDGSSTAPTSAGSYTVVGTIDDPSFAGTATDTLVIAKAVPTVTWSTPSAITYGTGLSSTQLAAKAGIDGTFSYTPAAGAILTAGTQNLAVTFTPTDATDYANATGATTIVVNPAPLTATADNQTRVYADANPTLTISYSGFVADDTAAALSSAPAATTTADATSAPGVYPITLSGGAADNYTLTLKSGSLTVTPRDFSGYYFGTFGSGGTWALTVHSDSTATFIAYLPERQSAIVVQLTLDQTGTFSVAGTEIVPQSTAGPLATRQAESVGTTGGSTGTLAAAFTLTGQVTTSGVSGQLAGLGQTFAGTPDSGTGSNAAGFYAATALGTDTGTTYTVVGPSGQAFALVVTPTMIDAAGGMVNSSGQLVATTATGGQLSLSLDAGNQSLSASVTPADASTSIDFSGIAQNVPVTSHLVNLSVRTTAGLGDQTLIVGFVVSGSGPKPVLVRGVGPTLSQLGVDGVLADPALTIYSGGPTPSMVGSNDDWDLIPIGQSVSPVATIGAAVGAFALPEGSPDAALYLPSQLTPGPYTVQITNRTGTTGVALAEIYDAAPGSRNPRLINVSARAQVGTGSNVLIAGFVVQGSPPLKLLVRAVGPTLTQQHVSGVLADPRLELYRNVNGTNVRIASNDNWGGTAALSSAFATTGAFSLPAYSKDAALLVTLPSGVYSAVVTGVNNGTGVALVEVYEVP